MSLHTIFCTKILSNGQHGTLSSTKNVPLSNTKTMWNNRRLSGLTVENTNNAILVYRIVHSNNFVLIVAGRLKKYIKSV